MPKMNIILILLVLALSLPTQASLDSGAVNKIRRAKSVADLRRLIAAEEDRKIFKIACHRQIKTWQVPSYCFSVVQDLSELMAKSLDSLCVERSRELLDPAVVERHLMAPNLSHGCKTALSWQKEVLIYKRTPQIRELKKVAGKLNSQEVWKGN